MMDTNKILVIGNGFDIDHQLPTSYKDFLIFCKCILQEKVSKDNKEKYDYLLLDIRSYLSENDISTFNDLIRNNTLIVYLYERMSSNNWVDFETELYKIISSLTCIEDELKKSNLYSYVLPNNHVAKQVLSDFGFGSAFIQGSINKVKLEAIKQSIYSNYKDLSKALELYISIYINKKLVQVYSPNVLRFDPDKVICFNYSNTFERCYLAGVKKTDIHYIHGKANQNSNNSEIVLGISSNITTNIFTCFEKYYQRIVYKTGNDYKKWINSANENNRKNEIVFFGHSLDPMDKEIIIDLIDNPNSHIIIYYYDQNSLEGIVQNLSIIFGKDKITEYVYGSKPKVELKQQDMHCDNNCGDRQILNDIDCINNLYLLCPRIIKAIKTNINTKYSEHDYNYFHSQENTLRLYESLLINEFPDVLDEKEVLEICRNLKYATYEGNLFNIPNIERDDLVIEEDQEKESKIMLSFNNLIDEINKENEIRYRRDCKQNTFYQINQLGFEDDLNIITDEILKLFSLHDFFEKYEKKIIEVCAINKSVYRALIKIKKDNSDLPAKSKAIKILQDYKRFEHSTKNN